MNEKVIIVSIVEDSYGSKIMKRIKKTCSASSTVFYGKGTISNHMMNILGFFEEKKEICISVVDQSHEDEIYSTLEAKLKLSKAGHGVMFSIPVRLKDQAVLNKEEQMNTKEAIFVVVDNGLSEKVVQTANNAGARGGTVIHARGQSQVEKKKLFQLDIEPEQEIVLIVANKKVGTDITDALTQELNLEDGNNGHLFVVDVSRTSGFYTGE